MRDRRLFASLCIFISIPLANRSIGQTITVPGATDADEQLNVTADRVIPLADAATISFSEFQSGIDPGNTGVYIPEKWAVVFRYSSVNIAATRTLSFTNHPSRAPVIWLVSGNVTINGTISLNGENSRGPGGGNAEPGPGGFRGGRGQVTNYQRSGTGMGPGGPSFFPGTCFSGPGAGYGLPGTPALDGGTPGIAYGNAAIIPIIGGSGGAMMYCSDRDGYYGGGGGGGALLIACEGTLTINGQIQCVGGHALASSNNTGGSGGAIRLVASHISGSGALRAQNGNSACCRAGVSSVGRVRVEAADTTGWNENSTPTVSMRILGNGETAQIWAPSGSPEIEIASIGIAALPAGQDPRSDTGFANTDLRLDTVASQTITIRTKNVPQSWVVYVRAVRLGGADIVQTAIFDHAEAEYSYWRINAFDVPPGVSVFQARAYQP